MDNMEQIEEIKKYKEKLSKLLGIEIESNIAAMVWIKRHAKQWRIKHPYQQSCTQS